MKTLQIPQRQFKKMSMLHESFYDIYGNEETVWDLDDLDEMRKIGQEFMDIFAVNFKK
jgi:hypothetical protein